MPSGSSPRRSPSAIRVRWWSARRPARSTPRCCRGLGGAELAFVVDPVDGTFNFASGVPLFGVMLAVVQDGETVAGIIHDPVGKDFLIGARGAGSHILSADGAPGAGQGRRRPCRCPR